TYPTINRRGFSWSVSFLFPHSRIRPTPELPLSFRRGSTRPDTARTRKGEVGEVSSLFPHARISPTPELPLSFRRGSTHLDSALRQMGEVDSPGKISTSL
ncbi:MAG TPA: hypothetical protein VFO54_11220, partial [Chryseosolibacter sp.]|nr:hypothetical protein [Chryseosolibacter sp.]